MNQLKFSNITPSTRTIIANMNITINIQECYNLLQITPYTVIQKKRGRKKKPVTANPNLNIPTGSIITLKFRDFKKGVDLKQKKNQSYMCKYKKFFRNALTIVMIINQGAKLKEINMKLSQNGKIQITGAKSVEQVVKCIDYFWRMIQPYKNTIYTFHNKRERTLKVIFDIVMTNILFNTGFRINRQNLDSYINQRTRYKSLYEPNYGYTGINIKFKVDNVLNHKLDKYTCQKSGWRKSSIDYKEYISTFLTEKEREKRLSKQHYNTFLVFYSGNIIMSGIRECYMKEAFNEFLSILKNNKNLIMENLTV